MTEHGSRYCVFVPSILDHPVVGASKPYSDCEAFFWLVFEATWKPRTYRAGSIIVNLQRGQLAHSTRFMAKAWGWPETNVRRFLSRLETGAGNGAVIGAETGAGVTVISICNYDRYQLGPFQSGAASGAENGAENGAKVAQTEESKKRKKDTRFRADDPDFAEWYESFPKKTKPKDAFRAYRKVIDSGEITHSDLMSKTRALAAHWQAQPKEEIKFCPGPAPWLNSGGHLEPDMAITLPSAIAAPKRDPKTFTDDEWRERLAELPQWSTYWGPRPGEPDCLVPGRLIVNQVEPTHPTLEAANG